MACAFSSVPPPSRYAVIPVARNVWQPILPFMPICQREERLIPHDLWERDRTGSA
jgi:hypothetical protein